MPYVSIRAHAGVEQSRRDDLESIGYLLVYLLLGYVPWGNVKINAVEKMNKTMMKEKFSLIIQHTTFNLPTEFRTYLEYCFCLKFEDTPDYAYLRSLFKNLFLQSGFENDGVFDWTQITGTMLG